MHRCLTHKSGISSIAAACSALRCAVFALLLCAVSPLAAQTAPAPSKFIPMFLVYYGGGPALVATDAAKVAKFDLLDIDRFRYNQLAPNTWSAIKALNPNIQIYLYEMGPESQNYMDSTPVVSINGMGRHDVSRGHSMGSLNSNHPELFLLDSSGNRIYNTGFSNPAGNQFWNLMDFGSPAYQAYWIEAVRADIANQPWVADGVHADNCLTFSAAGGYSAASSKYPTDTSWSNAMNTFSSAIAAGLHGFGQKLWCNKGSSYLPAGPAAWLALDASPNHPDVLAEEGAFAVTFGPWATQFISEANWKLQVDTMAAIKNSKVAMFSSTALAEGQSGTDNWGQPVTYWQTLWYALGSFLLGKNDTLNNAYFGFFGNGGSYDKIWWYNEYDKIDLGKALGPYAVTTIGGVNIYSREFEKGYVYVNPTATSAASVPLPQASQQLTHDNLLSLLSSIPIVSAISLNGHNAAIVLKTAVAPPADATPPTVPTGVSASAASSSQINLSWIASTDNVAVTGYRVYRDGALLTTLGAVTSYQGTGLAASTTYSYTVQAIDAAGNSSGQSAAASATTPAAPDTAAPSTPIGLVASAVSSSQINLSWNASTDNVVVTGYRVYRGGALLVTLGAVTTLQNTGLSPSTTYSYTVQAIDAAGNASGQSAAAGATTPAAPDTTAPSTPIGLVTSGVSSSQVNLSWNASTDNVGVTGYRVYRGGTLLTTLGAVTSYQDTGLSASTTYSYTVQAIDAAGNASGQSVAASATTPAAPDTTAPSAPTGLTATAASSSQISLSWVASTDNVGVTGYRVYRGGALLVTLGVVTALQNTGLGSSTTYSYSVEAVDAVGNASGQSAAASATTPAAADTTPPSVPTGLKGKAVSATQINLTWGVSTDNVGVAGYTVYLNDAVLANTTTRSFHHTGLTPGTTYSYRVSAFDAAGNSSAWTATHVSVKTPVRRIVRGDFNGDGKSDILWRNGATGENAIWVMNGATIASGTTFSTVADFTWKIAGVGDFDGDGKADIVWRNGAGDNLIWLMNGAAILSEAAVSSVTDFDWSIAGVGDFDGDGKSDILWYNTATGANTIWLMSGGTISGGAAAFATVADLNWGIAGIADFDGDGKSDILWHNNATGENLLWFMNGAAIVSAVSSNAMTDLNWSVAGTGDFDGDGKADILWRNGTTGQNAIWFMNGATPSSSPVIGAVADLNWSIAEIGDFNGDGKTDILWRNQATGQDTIWLMNGATLSSAPSTGAVADLNWSIMPR